MCKRVGKNEVFSPCVYNIYDGQNLSVKKDGRYTICLLWRVNLWKISCCFILRKLNTIIKIGRLIVVKLKNTVLSSVSSYVHYNCVLFVKYLTSSRIDTMAMWNAIHNEITRNFIIYRQIAHAWPKYLIYLSSLKRYFNNLISLIGLTNFAQPVTVLNPVKMWFLKFLEIRKALLNHSVYILPLF